jgi:hypothetical protein
MTQDQTLWDFIEEGKSKKDYLNQAEKDAVQRQTIKRLRPAATG